MKDLTESLEIKKSLHIKQNDEKIKTLQSELELRQKVEIHEI